MGKRRLAGVSSIIIVIAFVYMASPLRSYGNAINRASIYGGSINNPPLQQDFQTATYHEDFVTHHFRIGYSTYHNRNMRFSGIETYWDPTPGGWTGPSTHKALCNTGWSSSFFNEANASTAKSRLDGDCLVDMDGHGFDKSIEFANNTWLVDQRGHEPYVHGAQFFYVEDCASLDDMKFALLNSCSSSAGESNNITWFMRCIRGVDTVIGFDVNTWYKQIINVNGTQRWVYPGHCWNTNFWLFACRYNYVAGNAEGTADAWVFNHCQGNYFGFDRSETWGNKNARLWEPGDGVKELP